MSRMLLPLFRSATQFLVPALLLAGPAALAQKTTIMPPASEPHFVGGPDSLRALLGRVQRQASPALKGQVFLFIELNPDGVPAKVSFLRPPTATDLALANTEEVRELSVKLVNQLSRWQLDPALLSTDDKFALTVALPLTFGPTTSPLPLPYSDEKPVFPLPADFKPFRSNPASYTLRNFLQRQFRYPAIDLRNQVQGTVYGYFEVSETGALENRRVVGSLSPTIDAEVLRTLNTIPNATTPPRQQGRPMRVAYVVPVNLKIQ
jgi:protein TonB